MPGASQSSRLSKRTRADAPQNQIAHADGNRAKRRRFAGKKTESEKAAELLVSKGPQELTVIDGNMSVANTRESSHTSWSLSQLGAGQYTDLEPVLTADEE